MTDIAVSGRERHKFTARLKQARIGDPVAQYDVALMYAAGVGVTKNLAQAFNWTKAAAEKGHVAAQFLLGSAYLGGVGTVRDGYQALTWFIKAHEHGNEKASLKLARLLLERQPSVAYQLALKSAERGLADAQCMVAECLADGTGVAPDRELAHSWRQQAAAQGSPAAQYALGLSTMSGATDSQPSEDAIRCFRLAAKAGHPGAQWTLDRLDVAGVCRAQDDSTRARTGSRERRAPESRLLAYAANGRPEDCYHLGLIYEAGHSVERSVKQARHWWRRAAEAGDPNAQFALAQSMDGADPMKSLDWLRAAASRDLPEAQHALGQRYLHSEQQNIGTALMWISRSAEQGLVQAQWTLARLLQGSGQELIAVSTERAALGGVADAQFAMGERYRIGSVVVQNWFEACRWYQLAADQGHALAQCVLAGCYAEGNGVRQDLGHAFSWYERAAAQGLPQAQWNLGQLYATGLTGVPVDARKATLLCKRAANAGFAPAQATMGALFARAKKHERAVFWWTKAAQQGDLESQFNLAQAFRLGLGVERSDEHAFHWMRLAAEGGLAAAQSRLGLAYATGQGAALDPVEAAKWFELAAWAGDAAATANSNHAKQTMAPAQYAEAQRRAQEWARSQKLKT